MKCDHLIIEIAFVISHDIAEHQPRRNCEVSYDPERDVLVISGLADCPALEGDVRILFQTSSRTVPKGYEYKVAR